MTAVTCPYCGHTVQLDPANLYPWTNHVGDCRDAIVDQLAVMRAAQARAIERLVRHRGYFGTIREHTLEDEITAVFESESAAYAHLESVQAELAAMRGEATDRAIQFVELSSCLDKARAEIAAMRKERDSLENAVDVLMARTDAELKAADPTGERSDEVAVRYLAEVRDYFASQRTGRGSGAQDRPVPWVDVESSTIKQIVTYLKNFRLHHEDASDVTSMIILDIESGQWMHKRSGD